MDAAGWVERSAGRLSFARPMIAKPTDADERVYSPLIKPASINSRLKRRASAPPAQA